MYKFQAPLRMGFDVWCLCLDANDCMIDCMALAMVDDNCNNILLTIESGWPYLDQLFP